MKTLNIYLVHSIHLTNRVRYLNSTLEILSKIAENCSFKVALNMIKEPTKEFIENNIEVFNKRVKYDKEEGDNADDQFNTMINTLNVAQISNIERHREIFKVIKDPSQLHLILEDDVLVGEDYLNNIKDLFMNFKEGNLLDWDILFMCLASIEKDKPLSLVNSRDQYKFLLNKSSYFITPSIAQKLNDYLDIYRYNLKNGISKFIWDNKDVRSCVLNKHTFLEGSKMGIFPSSVNPSNFLFQNMHFVALAKLTNNEEITDEIIKEGELLYKKLEEMESPDVLHTMGVLYYKKKDYDNAKRYMVLACEKLQSQCGYVAKSSEIINNAINMFQFDQSNLEACKAKTPKYSA